MTRPASTGSPLTLSEGRAWAELRRMAGGEAKLEMRDELNHWIRIADNRAFAVAPGTDWWFFGGPLPDGASSVEIVAGGERHRGQSGDGLWLAAIPSDAVSTPHELVVLSGDGARLTSIELPPADLPTTPSVPHRELAPETAPLTLAPTRTWHELIWVLVGLVFIVLGASQALAGSPVGWAVIAFFGPLLAWGLIWLLSGVGDLHLDHDGLSWRVLRTHRYRWREVAAFRPGPFADIGFDFCGSRSGRRRGKRLRSLLTTADAELSAARGGLTAEQLAGLLNAWRDYYYARS